MEKFLMYPQLRQSDSYCQYLQKSLSRFDGFIWVIERSTTKIKPENPAKKYPF